MIGDKQEAENERQLVLRQVEAVMINKAAVDTAQQKLQNDLNEVKSDISDYEDRKAAITVYPYLSSGGKKCRLITINRKKSKTLSRFV